MSGRIRTPDKGVERLVEVEALKWSTSGKIAARDSLAIEEPLEIRLGGRRFTVTMRTPGHDRELVAGLLQGEGFVEVASDIEEIRPLRTRKGSPEPNMLDVLLNVPSAQLRERLKRNFMTSSSCGVCGKTCIDALSRRLTPIITELRISAAALRAMVPAMAAEQEIFAATGGLHAAALFDLAGRLTVAREDIGRHNAVDKVLGHALMNGITPLREHVLLVSGRPSFEIVQKAVSAGVPVLAGVSAPSSLAVELSSELGLTLVGFLRDGGFNIYSHAERIDA
jgi:FdhD protein